MEPIRLLMRFFRLSCTSRDNFSCLAPLIAAASPAAIIVFSDAQELPAVNLPCPLFLCTATLLFDRLMGFVCIERPVAKSDHIIRWKP